MLNLLMCAMFFTMHEIHSKIIFATFATPLLVLPNLTCRLRIFDFGSSGSVALHVSAPGFPMLTLWPANPSRAYPGSPLFWGCRRG